MTICVVTNLADWRPDIVGKSDILIAVDGGLDVCLGHNLSPDYVVGDFDSARKSVPAATVQWQHKTDKDYTDLEAALALAETMEPSVVQILTSFTGREDHLLANYWIAASHNLPIHIFTGKSFAAVVKDSISLRAQGYFSLLAIQPSSVSIKHARYELDKSELLPGSGLGVSNEFSDEPLQLDVHSGRIFVIVPTRKVKVC